MRVVALLRGVNVGGNNRLKMADLRAAVESLGHADIETYIQSGNLVFTPSGPVADVERQLTSCLRETCGVDVNVVLRTGAEMAAIVAANPYDRDDPTRVVVTFCPGPATAPPFDVAAYAPEGLTVHGREVYVDLPFGQGRSPLIQALAPFDDGHTTTRNWRTVLTLADMSES